MEVLPAGEFSDEDGTIFNRVYDVQNNIYSTHINFNGSYPTGGNVWIDSASMVASIHSESNKNAWKKLIYAPSTYTSYDSSVPPRMRESVEKLKDRAIYLDDSYFTSALEQLKQFLSMIMDELNQTFNAKEIEELCDFDYSIYNIKFKNYISTNWNATGGLGTGGLFGYDDSEKTTYDACVANFNNHLLDEFKNDWRKSDPNVTSDGLNTRYYHHILKSECNTVVKIDEKRSEALSSI